MKKIFTKIAICFCTICTLLFCGVACTPADNRTWEEKAWDELNSIGTGVFVDGTVGGGYAYDDSTPNGIAVASKIEIVVNEYENVVINILEGTSAGRTVTVSMWLSTSKTTGCMYFELTGDTVEFTRIVVGLGDFQLTEAY